MEEGERLVLFGELVGAVDEAVARVTQRDLIGAEEDSDRLGRAHIALQLHHATHRVLTHTTMTD
jgi:hypothetical protein